MNDHVFTRLIRARDFLRETCAERPPLPRVAAVAHMSTFHFLRRFEALFGQTPHQYRCQVRMQNARELLARGRYSVGEAGLALGYASVGSFSSAFTRSVGIGPQAFRRAARASVGVAGWPPPTLFPACLSLMGRLPADAFRNFEELRTTRSG